jgi:hypothetical protein
MFYKNYAIFRFPAIHPVYKYCYQYRALFYKCRPIALEVGTTAPEIMLFPNKSDPETGSRIPSISTGGAAINAIINTEVAVNRVGIIKTPNQPMYKRFSVLVIHAQKRDQRLGASRLDKIAVIKFFYFVYFVLLKQKRNHAPRLPCRKLGAGLVEGHP